MAQVLRTFQGGRILAAYDCSKYPACTLEWLTRRADPSVGVPPDSFDIIEADFPLTEAMALVPCKAR